MTTPAIAITGANGFVGRACVREARRRDLPVVAACRSAPPEALAAEWAADPGVSMLRIDLADPASDLAPLLPEHGALIHAAAHLGDSPEAHRRDTLDPTARIIAARGTQDTRIVLISSLAVYDTDLLSPGDAVTEASPLVPLPERALTSSRDAYAGAKRLQEALLSQDDTAEDDWILRPGAIWGPGRSWHALQGFWASKLHVTIGSDGELPLAHVDHVARTALDAATTFTEGVSVLNVFDDDRPTRARFLRAHKRVYGWPRLNLTVPYGLWLALVRLLRPVAGQPGSQKASRLPGLFQEPILRARMMPLTFPTTRLRSAFSGEDIDTFEGMMARTHDTETTAPPEDRS